MWVDLDLQRRLTRMLVAPESYRAMTQCWLPPRIRSTTRSIWDWLHTVCAMTCTGTRRKVLVRCAWCWKDITNVEQLIFIITAGKAIEKVAQFLGLWLCSLYTALTCQKWLDGYIFQFDKGLFLQKINQMQINKTSIVFAKRVTPDSNNEW